MTEKQHPLTDEMCREIAPYSKFWDFNDGLECEDVRAGADWQLEQDAEAWKIILNRMKILHPIIVDSIIEEFKKAMRPQEDN